MVLAIYGAGGLGREVIDLARTNNDGKWDEIIFVVDVEDAPQEVNGIPVYQYSSLKGKYSKRQIEFLIAIGEPSGRARLYTKLNSRGNRARHRQNSW